AIKFTETGGVTIRAAIDPARPEPRFGGEVEDTGIGIQADHLERIFQPFNQADNSITRKYGGTGLGLTICRYIVRELGGEITVESQEGRGSTFRVTLETGPLEGVPFIDDAFSEALRSKSRRQSAGPATVLPPVRVL